MYNYDKFDEKYVCFCIILSTHDLLVGASNGLSLTLNIEEYQYMKGPHLDAGVKVILPAMRGVCDMV